MKIKLKSLAIISTVILLVLITSVKYGIDPPAPEVTFHTISGKKIELAKLKEKIVLVTFWATDCANCIKEMPHLISLYNEFHSHGLEIIAVAMYYDPPNHVVSMTREKQLPYPVALDLKAEVANAFDHVKLTPSSFLISADKRIVFKTTGLFDKAKMKQRIANLLKG